MAERLDILTREADAREASDMAYEAAKADWESVQTQYQAMRGGAGDAVDRIGALVRKFGPKLAVRLGLPGGAAALTALTADSGSFSGLFGALRTMLGFLF